MVKGMFHDQCDDCQKARKQTAPVFLVELIDQLLATVQSKDAESVLGESGPAGQLKKILTERMLAAELTHHLPYEEEAGRNHRNGTSLKKVLTLGSELELDVPPYRLSSFGLRLVAKYQRRMMPGFDDHVSSMHARGMIVWENQAHLLELYGLRFRRSSFPPSPTK